MSLRLKMPTKNLFFKAHFPILSEEYIGDALNAFFVDSLKGIKFWKMRTKHLINPVNRKHSLPSTFRWFNHFKDFTSIIFLFNIRSLWLIRNGCFQSIKRVKILCFTDIEHFIVTRELLFKFHNIRTKIY